MPAFIILTVIIVVVVLVAKSIHDAQKGAAGGPQRAPRPSPAPPLPSRRPARPQARRPAKPVDEDALAEHVSKLRGAIQADLVTTEEAVASICRFTDGVLSEEAARQLLRHQGAA